VKAGEVSEVPIPLQPQTWIMGSVFNDKNKNGRREPNEGGLSGIAFSITGEGISREIRSGTNGKFIADLRPGKYQVELIENSLPERYEPTTPSNVSITTREYGRTEVKFGVYQKPKPVVVTFGPPTARFTYSPETPALGESITFNATESSAIQTTIESYKWEFSHNGTVIRREGKIIDVRLEKTGTWEVSLTVTDKNGLKGRAVKSLRVIEN
jgi:PKD repeat protein